MMLRAKTKQGKREIRHKRMRAKIMGTSARPRLCVFRSSKHIYAQLVDDEKGKTLAGSDDTELKAFKGKKIDAARKVGELIAKNGLAKKITKVVFDRGGYKYHGRVRALAEGARKGGLQF